MTGRQPRRRPLFLALGLAALAVLAGSLWASRDDLSPDDRRLTQRILQATAAVPVRDLQPDDWDYVCAIPPYSFPSQALPRRLPAPIAALRVLPSDRYVDEEYWGLAFVRASAAEARVFLVSNQAIYRIEGADCATRARATFQVDRVAAPNLTYTQLTIAGD